MDDNGNLSDAERGQTSASRAGATSSVSTNPLHSLYGRSDAFTTNLPDGSFEDIELTSIGERSAAQDTLSPESSNHAYTNAPVPDSLQNSKAPEPSGVDDKGQKPPHDAKEPEFDEMLGWQRAKARLEKKDEVFMKECDDEINGLLVFAGLFSAILTAFVIEVQKTLQEDPATVSANLLRHISMQLANQTIDPAPFSLTDFHSPPSLIAVNVLWFSSLLFSIFSALFGIFVKQWLHTLGSWSDIGNPMDAIRVRHLYRRGLAKWHVLDVLAILPSLLQLALLLFVVGLVTYLWTVDRTVAGFSTVLACLGFGAAIAAILLPCFCSNCSYKSPLGLLLVRFLGNGRQTSWRSRDLAAVNLQYNMPELKSAIKVHKDIQALLDIIPEADESAQDNVLIAERVNELDAHPESFSFKLLMHLIAAFTSSNVAGIDNNVKKSVTWILGALISGKTYVLQVSALEGLVTHLATMDRNTLSRYFGVNSMKGHINVVRKLLRILHPHKDTPENPEVKDAAARLSNYLIQWINTERSHTATFGQRELSSLQTEINIIHQDLHPTKTIDVQHQVCAVACSPDGATFAAGLEDGTVCIIDVITSRVTATLACHRQGISSVAFFPKLERIVTGSHDNNLKICNIKTSQVLNTFHEHTNSVPSVAVSPDGHRIVSGFDDNTVRIWSMQFDQGTVVLGGHSNCVYVVVFYADGTCIASGSRDKTVRLWDATTHQCLQTLTGHTGPVTSVAISPSGQMLVSASWDKNVRVWSLDSWEAISALKGHDDSVNCVKFSPDGAHIISTSDDKTMCLWDVATSTCVHSWQGHQAGIRSACFSVNGRQIVTGATDCTVRIWNAHPPVGYSTLDRLRQSIICVCLLQNEQHVAAGLADGEVWIWEGRTGHMVQKCLGHLDSVECLAFSPYCLFLVSGSQDHNARVWSVHTGECIQVLKGHTASVLSVTYSSNGACIASGSADKTVRLWNHEDGSSLKLHRHAGWVRCVAFSSDNIHLVSGSNDRSVRIWNAKNGEAVGLLTGHKDRILSVAISSNGLQVASSARDGVIIIWDFTTHQVVGKFKGDKLFHYRDAGVMFSLDRTCVLARAADGGWRSWPIAQDSGSPAQTHAVARPADVRMPTFSTDAEGWVVGFRDPHGPPRRLFWLIPQCRGVLHFQGYTVLVHPQGELYWATRVINPDQPITVLNFAGCI